MLARASGSDADDLAQEAFVGAWQRAGDFRGQGSYAAWVMGSAGACSSTSRARDSRRARRRRCYRPAASQRRRDRC
ncbi:sigma factor [Sphingopyxis sp. JAI128]|uniref:RNA polymerase sigma factor n=1 Tax=Sphingopyxis sp. JAI128 TaxID=2723066 RepID=UPI0016087323